MDNQAGLLVDHRSSCIATGDIVRANTNHEHGVPKRGRKLPEGGVKATFLTALLGLIAGPSIIHKEIKAAVCGVNMVEHRPHLCIIMMITAHSNTNPASLIHERCGLVNCSGQGDSSIVGVFGTSRYIDGGTGGTKRLGNPFPDSATG